MGDPLRWPVDCVDGGESIRLRRINPSTKLPGYGRRAFTQRQSPGDCVDGLPAKGRAGERESIRLRRINPSTKLPGYGRRVLTQRQSPGDCVNGLPAEGRAGERREHPAAPDQPVNQVAGLPAPSLYG